MNPLQLNQELVGVNPEVIFEIAGYPVTDSMITGFLSTIVLIIFVLWLHGRLRKDNPGRTQLAVELVFEYIVDLVTQIVGDRKLALKIIPWVGAVVIFIVMENFFTLIPGLAAVEYDGQSVFRTPTSDFNTTFAIAIVTLLTIHIYGIQKYNLFGYIGKYIRIGQVVKGFRKGLGAGLMSLIDLFLGLLDIVSEIARAISLSLRLFGNIFAGEVLLIVLSGILAVALPVPIIMLSLLFGILQAIVFGSLISSYFGSNLQD